jgi:Tol biopolymer transport system component
MVSDTYPDKKRKRSLLLIDLERDEVFELGRFYSDPKMQGENRCDLHPRWNHDGTKICFDSIHEGPRRVYVMDVSGIVGK